MTDERKIKMLRAALSRAMEFLPGPVADDLFNVLDKTK